MHGNRAFQSTRPGSEQPTQVHSLTAVARALKGSDLEGHSELPPEKVEADESLSPPGMRSSTGVAIAAATACVVCLAPTFVDVLPQILIPGPEQALPKLYALMGVTTSTVAAVLGLVGFVIIPEAAKTRREADLREKKQAAEHAVMGQRQEKVIELLEIVSRQMAGLQRAQAESATRSARPAVRNGQRVNRREAFGGAGPGVTTTLEPRWIQEARIELGTDGDYHIYALDDGIPEAFSRLEKDHPCSRWQIVIPWVHDRACLDAILKLIFSLNHYATQAAYLGRPFDLSKLEILVMDSPLSGYTTVLLPQASGPSGEIQTTVLQYTFADVTTGDGRIAVAVKGPLHDKALDRRDASLARSTQVQAGALAWALEGCLPTADGKVASTAIESWLRTPMKSIGELRNWRMEWLEDPSLF